MPGKEIEQAFATMSHGRTRYFEAGSGPDVLLVHGAGFVSGGHNWLPVMPALAESFHVYAVDCLGFGPGDHLEQPYSFAYLVDHLREFQDVMGMASSHVVGHSMGGWLGVLLAYESPHRVKRLVNVAGGGMRTRALHGMIEWSPPGEDEVRASLARLQGTAVEELEPELVAERVKAAGDPAVTAAFRRLMDHMTDPETRQRYGTMRRMPFIRARRCSTRATRKAACGASTTAGSSTPAAAASTCPASRPRATSRTRSGLRSYPCVERGGLVWAYMGSRAVPPPLPDLEPTTLPEDELHITATLRACNWVQALEGDIDTAHFSFLHFGSLQPAQAPPGSFLRMTVTDRAPRYQVIDTAWGVMYGAYRPAGEGGTYWRIGQFLFPFWTMVPVPVLGEKCGARAWVPLDDTHTMFYGLSPKRPAGAPAPPSDVTLESLQLPNSTDWYGRFRLEQDASNDYHIDRAMQRGNGSYTGIDGISTQDQAVTESMGPLMDRTAEHLGTSDAMVIRVRRRLLTAARAFRDNGLVPPGVDEPTVYRQRSGGVILREGADWIAETEDLRQAYIVRSELDRSLMTGT